MERWRQKALTILMDNRTVNAKSVSEEESRVFRRSPHVNTQLTSPALAAGVWYKHYGYFTCKCRPRVDKMMTPVRCPGLFGWERRSGKRLEGLERELPTISTRRDCLAAWEPAKKFIHALKSFP